MINYKLSFGIFNKVYAFQTESINQKSEINFYNISL